MTDKARHRTTVEMSRSVPPQVEAGTDLTLKVKVACPAGCDLRGRLVKVMAPTGIVVQRELIGFENLTNETDEFVVTAPPQVGEYAWNVVFPRHELKGVVHEESALTITSRTMPHPTSIAVWDVPSPVVVNSSFEVKAGLKCLVSCQLPGQLIAVRDEEGLQVGEGKLGDTPWPGTSALYGTKVNLAAPTGEGTYSWTVTFAGAESEIPHEDASAAFSFRAARPPDHKVTVTVVEEDSQTPLQNVQVRLGVYRALTDEHGLASLEVAKGEYDLDLWKVGYEMHPKTVNVTESVAIQVKAVIAPDKDPDDERVWM